MIDRGLLIGEGWVTMRGERLYVIITSSLYIDISAQTWDTVLTQMTDLGWDHGNHLVTDRIFNVGKIFSGIFLSTFSHR